MTSPDQLGQQSENTKESSEEAGELSHDTQQPLPSRFSLSRDKTRWLWITLSVIAVVGVSVALITVATGGGTYQAPSGGPSGVSGAPPGAPAPNSAARSAPTPPER